MTNSPDASKSAREARTQVLTESPGSSKLVLFDFDGTLTTKDTLIEFVTFYHGRKRFLWGMIKLAPVMALYVLKIIPNWKAKQFFLSQYFKGEKTQEFDRRCREFSSRVLPRLIRPEAMRAIEDYRRQHATMVVVSASAENWVKPWCDQNGIRCLATRLETKGGMLTGRIEGKNCYGNEKVCRIKSQYDPAAYAEVIAYGDTSGDREMLAMAHQSHYKPFRQATQKSVR